MNNTPHIIVIGGGPAGLRAAETAAQHGAHVSIYDHMRSVGRKFLIAGKSGLNLTHTGTLDDLLKHYSGDAMPQHTWRRIISGFDNTALRKWAAGLGIDTFEASSGKVFPSPVDGSIKAAPLLRRWIKRLREHGVSFKTKHRWTGISPDGRLEFSHDGKTVRARADATILALGGASWPTTGSDGHWTSILTAHGIRVTPLTPANCGWEADWPAALTAEAAGLPIKNATLHADGKSCRGELVITRYGLEGGPIYRLGPAIRSLPAPHVVLDFKPDLSRDQIIARLGNIRRNYVREARRKLKLDPATCAILKHLPNRGPWTSAAQLADEIKHCHIPLTQPRPISEAISSAGGIHWQELDDNLMLKKLPGIHAAGEMIDWDAPTGGYLLQACFSTGHHAANSLFT